MPESRTAPAPADDAPTSIPLCACGQPVDENALLYGDGLTCSACLARIKVGRERDVP